MGQSANETLTPRQVTMRLSLWSLLSEEEEKFAGAAQMVRPCFGMCAEEAGAQSDVASERHIDSGAEQYHRRQTEA